MENIRSFFRLDTDLKKRRFAGTLIAVALLTVFLIFNRIPKLDTVEADLAIATSPIAECFQGFCLENVDHLPLWKRWWNFSLTYLNLVWIGMVFAFLMAGITESFLFPEGTDEKFTGHGARGVLKGAIIGPVMTLCSACIVPIATAFRRRGAGIDTTVAITQGSSTMNLPALIMASMVFIPLIGGTRILLSIVGTFLLGSIVAGVVGGKGENISSSQSTIIRPSPDQVSWKESLIRASGKFSYATIRQAFRLGPIMVIAGFISGFVIQWISPQAVTTWIGDDILGILIAAALGIAINVPLMFEIPLVAAMLLAGMGTAPAGALLFTAAAGGPITYWGLAKIMPIRGVVTLAFSTWTLGAIGGILLLAVTSIIEEDRKFSFRADYSTPQYDQSLLPPPVQTERSLSDLWNSPSGHIDNPIESNPRVSDENKIADSRRLLGTSVTNSTTQNPTGEKIILQLHPSHPSEGLGKGNVRNPIVTYVTDDDESKNELTKVAEILDSSNDPYTDGLRYVLDLGLTSTIKILVIVWASGLEQTIFNPPFNGDLIIYDPTK